MIIRCVYEKEPSFPATDQHPDAVRYKIGARWVDAIGGEPTQAEVDALLNSAVGDGSVDAVETVADLKKALIDKGLLTQAEIDAAKTKDK